jgi:uncharacterized protein (TIGR03067 family)
MVCLLVASAGLAADQDDAKAMQGTWVIESAQLAGRNHTDDFAGMKLVIDGNRYVVEFGKNTDKGTFTLDPTKTPRRIDVVSAEGPFKGKTLPGIYELKGDNLTLCFEADGKGDQRPTKFEAPEMTRFALLTYRREKK